MIRITNTEFWATRTCDLPAYPAWIRCDESEYDRYATQFEGSAYQLGHERGYPAHTGLGQFPLDEQTLNHHSRSGRIRSLFNRTSPEHARWTVGQILTDLPIILMELAL